MSRCAHTNIRRRSACFTRPDTDPSLDLAVPVLQMPGIDNYTLPFPKLTRKDSASASGVITQGSSATERQLLGVGFP